MRILSFKKLSALLVATVLAPSTAIIVQAEQVSEKTLIAQRAIRYNFNCLLTVVRRADRAIYLKYFQRTI